MVVTRFAPSPTGLLHLGHVYAAWFARTNGDKMLLRIEDIDPMRCRPEYTLAIIEDLEWLGIQWDGEVRQQSNHFADYSEALRHLTALGLLYPCFCTRKDIETATEAEHETGSPMYPGTCRGLDRATVSGRLICETPFVFRLDSTKAIKQSGQLSWTQCGQRHRVDVNQFGDFVVARKDIQTSYHLSVTVDDTHQGVTLVTRGEDLESSVGPQRLLQALLGYPEPEYRHHGLVCDETGNRLAKRDNSTTIRSLREKGMSPADVIVLAKSMVKTRSGSSPL